MATSSTRQRRRVLVVLVLVAVTAAALVVNAVLVSRQSIPAAAGGRLVATSDGELHVVADGPEAGPVVVLIHGTAGSAAWWTPVVPALARTHRVLRIDLLGCGRSAKPDVAYDIPAQARRVAEALAQLGVARAAVVGHSVGGLVATALAEQRPGLVSALALIGTGPTEASYRDQGLLNDALRVPVLGQLLWRLRTDATVRKGMDSGFTRAVEIPAELIADARAITYKNLVDTRTESDAYLRARPMPDRVAALRIPLFVIFGTADQRWDSAAVVHYRQVPGARIEMLDGVGHSPMFEEPDRTAALLAEFAGPV